jgi:hypothetical protein
VSTLDEAFRREGAKQQACDAKQRSAEDLRRIAASWLLWPLLAAASCAATALGLRHGVDGSFILAAVYLGLALTLGCSKFGPGPRRAGYSYRSTTKSTYHNAGLT